MSRTRRRAALLLLIAGAALALRIWLPFDAVFGGGFINFQEDAWYHARAIDHLVRNFPHRLTLDPFASAGGQYVAIAPLFDYLVASVALGVGWGAPSARQVEMVAALLPALLGALATWLVYAIGRRLFDARAGLLAAALVAVSPGHFFTRTLLGAADHHALESVLALSTLLFAILACQDTPGAAAPRERWRAPAAWLTGFSLGAYCLTWTSAAFLVAVLGVWLALQWILDAMKGRPAGIPSAVTLRAAAVALSIVLLLQNPAMFRYGAQVSALAGLLVLSAGLQFIERMRRRTQSLVPLTLIMLAVLCAAAALAAWRLPALGNELLYDLARLKPDSGLRTVTEMQPLLLMDGRFSFLHPWGFFRTIFYTALPAIGALGIRIRRQGAASDTLALVWTMAVLLATLGQNRFGYYLVPMLALLTGWGGSWLLGWAGRGRTWSRPAIATALLGFVFLSGVHGAAVTVADMDMPEPWRRALVWLREQSPEPFGDPEYYYARFDDARTADYTVLNWWDAGYWIVRAGRRVPVANPTQLGAYDAARVLTANSEADAAPMLDRLRARYVIVDRELVYAMRPGHRTLQGKFGAVASWAGEPAHRFFESMMQRTADGRLVSVRVFYPEYYRSLAVRLYLHGTAAAAPQDSTYVITYADRVEADGATYRELVRAQRFATYAEAVVFRDALGEGPFRIAGRDPLRTCVPLPEVTGLRLVHEEGDEPGSPPSVRIFERR